MALSLTDSKAKAAKPKDRPYRLSAGNALSLFVSVAGGKSWQLKYRLGGREQVYTIGRYPMISLSEARGLASEARVNVSKGEHPLKVRREQSAARQVEKLNTFGAIANEWLTVNEPRWAANTAKQARVTMTRYVISNPVLSDAPIGEVRTKDVRNLLKSIAERTELRPGERKKSGSVVVARNVLMWCRSVFAFAIERELVEVDPTSALRGLTELRRPAGSIKHNKQLTTSQLGEVALGIDRFGGTEQVRYAMLLLMLFFVRTGELRQARWSEFDFKDALWRLPAQRMKSKRDHSVPLSKQALVLLKEWKQRCPSAELVFPNQRAEGGCMSPTTVNRALERMGFNGQGTMGLAAHGFRGTASTLLHERGMPSEAIETQLAHAERGVKGIYNGAKYMEKRRELMQVWADLVDEARAEATTR